MTSSDEPEVRPRLGEIPSELVSLAERVRALPDRLRRELEPMLDDAMEQAVFRGRVLCLARDALARFRLDLEVMRFDLDQTKQEREDLERRLATSWDR
jgi:hypothetical protein